MRKDKKHYDETTLQFNNRLLAKLMNDQTRALEKFNDTIARLAKTKELEYWAKQVEHPEQSQVRDYSRQQSLCRFWPCNSEHLSKNDGLAYRSLGRHEADYTGIGPIQAEALSLLRP
jgi:hypothetical protein